MIEVFKTNVEQVDQAKALIEILYSVFPDSDINFDLEDCDKILRVKSPRATSTRILSELKKQGFICEELQD